MTVSLSVNTIAYNSARLVGLRELAGSGLDGNGRYSGRDTAKIHRSRFANTQPKIQVAITMICQRCNRLLLNRSLASPSFRAFATGIARSNPESPPPATSTSAAQPFSTPFTPSPSKIPGISTKDKLGHLKSAPRSSVPAGAPLRGLGYIKGQEAPLAREDDEYPSWLWGLLSTGKEDNDSGGPIGDAFGEYIVSSTVPVGARTGRSVNGFPKHRTRSLCYTIAYRSLKIWSHCRAVSIAEANPFFNSQIKEATTPCRKSRARSADWVKCWQSICSRPP